MENGSSSLRRRLPTTDDKVDSPNLRDFLRVKDDDAGRNLAGVSLNTVLGQDGRPLPVNRTLLDIIRDDPYATKESKKSWKVFRDKLRLRRAGAAWTSSVHIPTSDVPIVQNPNRMISRRNSTRTFSPATNSEYRNPESSFNTRTFNSTPTNRSMLRRNSSRIPSPSVTANRRTSEGSASFNTSQINNVGVRVQEEEEEEEEEEGEEEEEEGGGGEPAVKMSLMALLAETDREMGLDGCTSFMASDDDDEDEDEEESSSVGYNNCCVCMVRHKGAALIPCGHTFCRMCSRELWVQRGNCPLCNGFILEILDIF